LNNYYDATWEELFLEYIKCDGPPNKKRWLRVTLEKLKNAQENQTNGDYTAINTRLKHRKEPLT